MKILIKYLLSFFSVALFLLATSGFTVYTHYCSDTAKKKQSLIASQIACSHKSDVSKSYEIHDLLSSCCTANTCHTASEPNECCTDANQFYKLTNVFNLPTVIEEEKCFSSHAMMTSLVLLNNELEKFYEESESYYSLPPPISGKQLVILYHQLKTDPDTIV